MNFLSLNCPSARRFLEVYYATTDLYKSGAHFESLNSIKDKWTERHLTHCKKCQEFSRREKLRLVK